MRAQVSSSCARVAYQPTEGITCRYEMAVGSTWKLRWVETRNEIPDIINIAGMG